MAVAEDPRLHHAAEVGSRRPINPTSASAGNGLLPMVATAPSGRCEFYSTTHGNWIQAKIMASDVKTGAIQIDKKPGVWISPDEQQVRIRVTQASVDRAAKDARTANARPKRGSADASAAPEPAIVFPAPVAVTSEEAASDFRSEAAPAHAHSVPAPSRSPLEAHMLNGDSCSGKSLGLRARGTPLGSRRDAESLGIQPSLHAGEVGGSTASNSAPQVRDNTRSGAEMNAASVAHRSMSREHFQHMVDTQSGSYVPAAHVSGAHSVSQMRSSSLRASQLSGRQDAGEFVSLAQQQYQQAMQRSSAGVASCPPGGQAVSEDPVLRHMSGGSLEPALGDLLRSSRSLGASSCPPGGQAVNEDPMPRHLFGGTLEPVLGLTAGRPAPLTFSAESVQGSPLPSGAYPALGKATAGQGFKEEPLVVQPRQQTSGAFPDLSMASSTAKAASISARGQSVSDDLRAGYPVSGNLYARQVGQEETLVVQPSIHAAAECPDLGIAPSARPVTPSLRRPMSQRGHVVTEEPLIVQPRQQTSAAYPDFAMASSAARAVSPLSRGPSVGEEPQAPQHPISPTFAKQQPGALPFSRQVSGASTVTAPSESLFLRQVSQDSVISDATLPAPAASFAANSLPDPPIWSRSDTPSAFSRQLSGGPAEPLRAYQKYSTIDRDSQLSPVPSADEEPVYEPEHDTPVYPKSSFSPGSARHQSGALPFQVGQVVGQPGQAGPPPICQGAASSLLGGAPTLPSRGQAVSEEARQAVRQEARQPVREEPQQAVREHPRQAVKEQPQQAVKEEPLPQRPANNAADDGASQDSGAAATAASGTAAAPASENRSTKSNAVLPVQDVIALDEYGRPLIMRQIHPETGSARTLVMNDDGSHRVFGEHTVASLTSSSEEEAKAWVDSLNGTQLRGLVHEVGQRLLEGSRLYHARLGQLEKMGEHLNYVYFGLTADSSDKELDNAYRSLARRMHPDKNGGTEDAKRRFQQMKERYELLKKRRGMATEDDECDVDVVPDCSGGEEEADEDGAKRLKDRRPPKSGEEEEEEATVNDKKVGEDSSGNIEYDPGDRDSMLKTVGKMLGQLKNVEVQMKVVVKELKRIQSEMVGTGAMPRK